MKQRCTWAGDSEIYIKYHDEEWGVPVYNDQKLFEMLILEGAQAGLNWITILRKRENYLRLFDHFDAGKIAEYDERKIEQLLSDPGIVRNRLKIRATISNARAYLKVKETYGTFSEYIWSFSGGRQIVNRWKKLAEIPASTELSDKMSKALKKEGFSFVGSTICYAFMQAVGIVNDHTTDCFRYNQVNREKI